MKQKIINYKYKVDDTGQKVPYMGFPQVIHRGKDGRFKRSLWPVYLSFLIAVVLTLIYIKTFWNGYSYGLRSVNCGLDWQKAVNSGGLRL